MPRLTTLQPRLQGLRPGLPNVDTITDTGRLRGRAAVTRRAHYLRQHPLCVDCNAQGRATAAVVVDHVLPLWKGGADDYEANGQSLCQPHHDAKTAREAAERAAGGGRRA